MFKIIWRYRVIRETLCHLPAFSHMLEHAPFWADIFNLKIISQQLFFFILKITDILLNCNNSNGTNKIYSFDSMQSKCVAMQHIALQCSFSMRCNATYFSAMYFHPVATARQHIALLCSFNALQSNILLCNVHCNSTFSSSVHSFNALQGNVFHCKIVSMRCNATYCSAM